MIRPPPTRPHVAIRSSTLDTHDWAEDDAWDSTSDNESSPRTDSNLSFSYTHLHAPNPSSYPPRPQLANPPKHGWTIVRKSSKDSRSLSQKETSPDPPANPPESDIDVDGDMILGELDTEPSGTTQESLSSSTPITSAKPKSSQGILRENLDEIVNDPLYGIRSRLQRSENQIGSVSRAGSPANREKSEKLMRERSIRTNRRLKFVDCLSSEDVSIAELRKLAWAGIPSDLRPMAWQLLLGYLPLPSPSRITTLARKRKEYQSLVEVAFARDRERLDQQIWHQIEIDVPRTRPGVRLWMYGATQRSLERILYVWAIRHPASGYVQGINDLVTPFFQVFLSAYIDSDPEDFDPALLPTNVLSAIEADSFWCLSRLLDGIQDNYIFAQPGIQRSVRRMAELVARIDAPLYAHLEVQNVEFMQFAFRWMNCLLMREISVQNTIRMWDTYLAEGPDAFSQFHLYVCSAFLVKWSEKLRKMDFQGIIMFLQSLPTQGWGDHEIEMLLSEAFVLNSIWHNAQSHFNGK
ncbi:tbc1 domain family protein [Moniliophthora roreri MCA 2997]|uniref:Tbc1 domain family protein n=2 Tax=Moniliophthora roreri TaxID=221103 RepID=V2YY83_MONRO|nr:tbc1 domain family protein [Moniliophthora roreri MCA 2997]KAI3618640.1 tbc1 domain family protein [Moniliophthora roreri]